jgi:hypothetical protein
MNINLHIERLILDGITIDTADCQALQVAVEAELTRCLSENGIGPNVISGDVPAEISGDTISIEPHHTPSQLGEQIGQAVHKGIDR